MPRMLVLLTFEPTRDIQLVGVARQQLARSVSSRGGSASKWILYTYVTFSGDIRYDNRSYAVVIQRKSYTRRQILAPSVPSCVHVNDLSFKMCVF